MALDSQEQELFDFAIAALPPWYTSDERQREELAGFAKMFGSVRAVVTYWFAQTLIGGARGPESGLPDWLNQHAVDRGTRRQSSESDPALRSRLRNVPDALTRASLLAATNAILLAEGVGAPAAMVELPRDGAALGGYVSDTGNGGTLTADSGTRVVFTPATPFARPPWRAPAVVRKIQTFDLVVAGAANAGNNGVFPVLGVSGDGAIIDNAGGVLGAEPGATWTVRKRDRRGNVRDGFSKAYASRGYRVSALRPVLIIVLPFGASSSTEASVREMLRQKKAAGFLTLIERRTSP